MVTSTLKLNIDTADAQETVAILADRLAEVKTAFDDAKMASLAARAAMVQLEAAIENISMDVD